MGWECSGRYDASVMTDHLGDLYICMDTQVNSTMMGFCQNRSRRYGLLCLKSAVCPRFSSLQNVMRLFHRDRDPDVGFLFSVGAVGGGDMIHDCF